jgi:hypothetical protein
MGHLLKNTKFKTAGYALGVPGSISSSGPDNPVVGQMRYNTTTNKLEFDKKISCSIYMRI